jgi:putative PIN family toxin of toxin-antitoxin system
VIRAVLDTNILASAAAAKTGPLATLRELWTAGLFEVALSSHILGELERTLSKPYFTSRLDAETHERFLAIARSAATTVITTPIPEVASTYEDNLVIATAESAGVPYLVTGNAELLRLRLYKTVFIVSARAFVTLLEIEDPQP